MTTSDSWIVENAYGDEPPSRAVVRSVAVATDRSVVDLDPLYEVVDPDALNALLAGGDGPVATFRYEGCDVRVTTSRVVVDCSDDVCSSAST